MSCRWCLCYKDLQLQKFQPAARDFAFCATSRGNPGYPQEDIIIIRNKGGVTVSQKRRRGSGVRTQEGQYV